MRIISVGATERNEEAGGSREIVMQRKKRGHVHEVRREEHRGKVEKKGNNSLATT